MTHLKPSDVIAMAVADPSYLAPWETFKDSEPFMCHMVKKLHKEGLISNLARMHTLNAIDEAIDNQTTLFSHLSEYRVPGYKLSACTYTRQPNDIRIQFWAMLCMRLKAQGK